MTKTTNYNARPDYVALFAEKAIARQERLAKERAAFAVRRQPQPLMVMTPGQHDGSAIVRVRYLSLHVSEKAAFQKITCDEIVLRQQEKLIDSVKKSLPAIYFHNLEKQIARRPLAGVDFDYDGEFEE